MSLRTSPTMTPKRLLAIRISAQRSSGPRTGSGKLWSRMNALRSGNRSRTYDRLLEELLGCAPGAVDRTAAMVLLPEELTHPVYANPIERCWHAQEFAFKQTLAWRSRVRSFKKKRTKPERPLESTPFQNEPTK